MTSEEVKNLTKDNYRNITFDGMKAFIENEHPTDKDEFKSHALKTRDGKDGKQTVYYSHTAAYQWFVKQYRPDLFTKKPSRALEALTNW